MGKDQRLISEDDVERVFDAKCIRTLAILSKIPEIERFGADIREDARIYTREARESSDNELYKEIKRLHDAADRNLFERVRSLIEHLSPRARAQLAPRWGQTNPRAKFPEPNDFDFIDQREATCVKLASLCRVGGKYTEGRMRPSGKRSWTWRWCYFAPKPSRHFRKRSVEQRFVRHLALTWHKITGKPAPKAVHRHKPGPFAIFVRECLRFCENREADPINLINNRGRRRTTKNAPAVS